jgi:hypothetical protein
MMGGVRKSPARPAAIPKIRGATTAPLSASGRALQNKIAGKSQPPAKKAERRIDQNPAG